MQAKKSLGQNFLKSKSAIADILKASDLSENDIVLEVGPGKGVLTEALLNRIGESKNSSGKIIVVEKDDRLIPLLQEKFETAIKNEKLIIVHQDILEFKPESIGLKNGSYKVIANIPYYITGLLFRQFLESECQPSKMVLMVQKEVAKRIVANDKKESILSLSVKIYGEPKYIKTVPARYFAPAPKVDSAILLVNNISKKILEENNLSEKNFFEVIKAGFAHKRKLALKNLETLPEWGLELSSIAKSSSVDIRARAEDMTLGEWITLARQYGRS